MSENFTEKLAILKKQYGITSAPRQRKNSKFAVVKEVLSERNSGREEALCKILSNLKGKGIEINDDVFKQVMRLIGNYLTYVRHPDKYKGYDGLKLVDKDGHFQVIKA